MDSSRPAKPVKPVDAVRNVVEAAAEKIADARTGAQATSNGVATGTDRLAALKELADLKAQGVLTEAEFEAEKAKILAS